MQKQNKPNRFIFWVPRILSIIFILFLAMFSLDIFGNDYTFWETVAGLFMHNIPSLVLTILLIISWKHEIVGAVAFISAGLLYTGVMVRNAWLYTREGYMLSWVFTIAGPAFLIGVLFLIGWLRKRNKK